MQQQATVLSLHSPSGCHAAPQVDKQADKQPPPAGPAHAAAQVTSLPGGALTQPALVRARRYVVLHGCLDLTANASLGVLKAGQSAAPSQAASRRSTFELRQQGQGHLPGKATAVQDMEAAAPQLVGQVQEASTSVSILSPA